MDSKQDGEKKPLLEGNSTRGTGDGDLEMSKHVPVQPPSLALQVFSAVLYGGAAVTMNFVNKFTMKIFPLTNILVALQMACTWAILQALRDTGHVSFPAFSWQKAKQLSGITALYTANTVFALVGLKTLNIPMYNVLKRLTPMMILVLKAMYRRRWPADNIVASVGLVVFGCIVAGIGDLTFDLWGYIYALMSCACQSSYLLIVEFQGCDFGVGSTEMLYYNAVTSLPLLLMIAGATGEVAALSQALNKGVLLAGGSSWFWINVMSCALMGMLLNYAQFLCTNTNSALTTTIVGVAKGVLAVLLGFFFLGGVPFSLVNVIGIILNTIGVIWYTVIKYNSRTADK